MQLPHAHRHFVKPQAGWPMRSDANGMEGLLGEMLWGNLGAVIDGHCFTAEIPSD